MLPNGNDYLGLTHRNSLHRADCHAGTTSGAGFVDLGWCHPANLWFEVDGAILAGFTAKSTEGLASCKTGGTDGRRVIPGGWAGD